MLQLVKVVFLNLAVAIGGIAILFAEVPWLAAVAAEHAHVFEWSFYRDAIVTSFVLVLVLTFGGFLFVSTVPRLLGLFLKTDKVYPLYGFHYGVHRTIARLTNSKILTKTSGDSSYIVPYLRAIGYRLTPVVQTGSNFGTDVKHDSPYHVSIGTGTVCASELSIVNALLSNSSFRVARASIGANNFLGNMISYPALSKTGDNCLLGTKALVPIDGPVRQGVGLLGSPSFEIPRMVQRDSEYERLAEGADVDGRLRAKNRHNLLTIGLLLLSRWVSLFAVAVVGGGFIDKHGTYGHWVAALGVVFMVLFSVAHGVFFECAGRGFRPVVPTYCSIYLVDFWRRERFFKLTARAQGVLNGTPFKGLVLRLLGVRVGRRLYDEGVGMPEKNLVTIGDSVVLNAGSVIQCHTQEDYGFKSDRIVVGSGATIGVGAMVHYGTTVGEGATLAPDSFLMKGGEVPAHAWWGGNPAREMPMWTNEPTFSSPATSAHAASPPSRVRDHGYIGRHRTGTRTPALAGAR